MMSKLLYLWVEIDENEDVKIKYKLSVKVKNEIDDILIEKGDIVVGSSDWGNAEEIIKNVVEKLFDG